jgi:hypothetical protein
MGSVEEEDDAVLAPLGSAIAGCSNLEALMFCEFHPQLGPHLVFQVRRSRRQSIGHPAAWEG